ncbi:hypothetical protein F-S17_0435 [Faustovirus]|nr:hypothetical protein F-S17_0435 [Faustovirus]
MEAIPDELILYMCDISEFNYMYLYRVNRRYTALLRAYKRKMKAHYLSPFNVYHRIDEYSHYDESYSHINNVRNGYYQYVKFEHILYTEPSTRKDVLGAYRDGKKHGIWQEFKNKSVIIKTEIYYFGRLKMRVKYNAEGMPCDIKRYKRGKVKKLHNISTLAYIDKFKLR